MFIIKVIKSRPSNNYPVQIHGIVSAKNFHIYPKSVHYTQNEIEWCSPIDMEKGDTAIIVNALTGETLDTYKCK